MTRALVVIRLLEAFWALAGLATGVMIGALLAGGDGPPERRRRRGLWLVFATLVAVVLGVGVYHAALAQGRFVSRAAMGALALEVVGGVTAVTAAAVAALKLAGWLPVEPARPRGQPFVTAPIAAFGLGMLAYLVAYPRTPWVLHALIGLAVLLGTLVAVPAAGAALPRRIGRLNLLVGLAAVFAGVAMGHLPLMLIGAVAAGAGIVAGR